VHAAVVGRIELRSSASSETVCVRTSTSRVERFALIRQSRSHDKYADFSVEERTAYKRVHEALRQLGQTALTELGGVRDYVLKLTSGFHPASGIRGGKPKDLWFGVYRKENEKSF